MEKLSGRTDSNGRFLEITSLIYRLFSCLYTPETVKWQLSGGRREGLQNIIHSAIVHSIEMGVRIYKTRWFFRYCRRERISDNSLCEAIKRAERGIVDADLGGGVIKQRIARSGQGRSSGYRMLIAYRTADLAVFLYGFAKNESDNIEDNMLATLKEIAAGWLEADKKLFERAIREKYLQEVHCDNEK